jgi:hypothetical protein
MIKSNFLNTLALAITMTVVPLQISYSNSSEEKNNSLNTSSPQLTSEAIDYLKRLTVLFPELKIANYNYSKAVTKSRRVRSIERNRQDLIKIIKKNQAHISTSPMFHNDSTFRTELAHYLDLLYLVMKRDFDKILDMEDIEAQAYDEDEAHQIALDMAFAKLDTCHTLLTKTESHFFKTYNIQVDTTVDILSKKIEKANDAIDYYNPIYKIFYKSNKQYSYAKQALGKKDLAALQQHTAALEKFVREGSEDLKKFKGYENDDNLIKMVAKLLEFYNTESTVMLPMNIEFFLQVETFQNALKKYEAIKPDKRTQKDVDEYNKEVNIYNDAVKKINQTNNSSYKKHSELLKEWNKAADKFFELHS